MSQFLFNSVASRGIGSTKPAVVVLDGQYAQDAVALVPLAYYRFGEAVGEGDMLDSSGNSRHGSYVGDVLLGQAALCSDDGGDTALRLLAGTDQCVAPTVVAPILSISCFVQISNVSGQHTIAEEDSAQPDDGWSLEVLNGKLRAYIRSTEGVGTSQWIGGAVDGPVGYGTLVNNTIHHVILRFGTGGAELWLDGTQLIQDTGLTDSVVANNAQLIIGSYHDQNGLAGFIDEFLIFDRTLNSGEIAQLNDPATVVPAPVAQNDTFPDITEETGNHDFDVLVNDSYTGTPTIVITDQTGPGTATVTGTGAASLIRVPTAAVDPGLKTVTYELTNSGGAGSSQAVLSVTIAAASVGAWCEPLITNGDLYPATGADMPAKPTRLSVFLDSQVPGRIIRVTGNAGEAYPNGVSGTWITQARRHHYAKSPAWNADGSRLLLLGASSSSMKLLLNGVTYAAISATAPPGGAFSRWHPTLSDRMITIRNPNELGYWFHATNSFQIIEKFNGYTFGGLGAWSGGMEANFDLEGRYCTVVARLNADNKRRVFVYDLVSGSKGNDFNIEGEPGATNLDVCHWDISCSGEYVVRHTDSSCSVRRRITPGNTIFSNASGTGGNRGHQSTCQSLAGDDYMTWVQDSDVKRWGPFANSGTWPAVTIYDGHSGNNAGANHTAGWAGQGKVLVATEQGASPSRQVRHDEAILVDLINGDVQRLARLRGPRAPNNEYRSEHHPSMTWDYKRFIFASNWDYSPSVLNTDAFVVETCDYEGQLFA